jgi:hypothetical protein
MPKAPHAGGQSPDATAVNYIAATTVIQLVLDAAESGFVEDLRKLVEDLDVVFPVDKGLQQAVQQLMIQRGVAGFSPFAKSIVSMNLKDCPPGYRCPPIS